MLCRTVNRITHHDFSCRRGFTLLEVIIASAIFAISLMSLIPLLLSSYRVDTETLYRVRAQQAAAQRLDELLSRENLTRGLASAVTDTDYIDAHTGSAFTAPPPVPVVITRTWTISPPRPSSHLYPVAVNSSYTYKNATKNYQVLTLKGR